MTELNNNQNKWARTIQTIASGRLSLDRLKAIEAKVGDKIDTTDPDSLELRDEVQQAINFKLGVDRLPPLLPPKGRKVCFLSFCPNADIDNRLDLQWVAGGYAEVWNWKGEKRDQLSKFKTLEPGDVVYLKKQRMLYRKIELFHFGIVTGVLSDQPLESGDPRRRLAVDWADQDEVIELPLSCSQTVDLKTISQIESAATPEFRVWCNWRGHNHPVDAPPP